MIGNFELEIKKNENMINSSNGPCLPIGGDVSKYC